MGHGELPGGGIPPSANSGCPGKPAEARGPPLNALGAARGSPPTSPPVRCSRGAQRISPRLPAAAGFERKRVFPLRWAFDLARSSCRVAMEAP